MEALAGALKPCGCAGMKAPAGVLKPVGCASMEALAGKKKKKKVTPREKKKALRFVLQEQNPQNPRTGEKGQKKNRMQVLCRNRPRTGEKRKEKKVCMRYALCQGGP
jgi:hypothetical protein